MRAAEGARLSIGAASGGDLGACLDILMDSILGEEYFTREVAEPILREAIGKGELVVARSEGGEVLGFYRLVHDGVFLVFAYVHLLAVKSGRRGQGIGRRLLEDAEARIGAREGYPYIKKSFLLVGKGNPRAKRFYELAGYRREATLKDLFAPGDSEFLMVKELSPPGA
jgi:ribosomal protein S18 acetylase RimI-like enzyme